MVGIVMCAAATPVAAIDRESGEFWTYEMTTSIDLPPATVEVNGTVTYTFEEQRTLVVNSLERQVNMIAVAGELDGASVWFGQPVKARVVLNGFLYEDSGSAGTVREESNSWVSGSIGPTGFEMAVELEIQNTITFSPGKLLEFDPATAQPGHSWIEVVSVDEMSVTRNKGSIVDNSQNSYTETLSVSVAPSLDTLSTPAGEFDALKISVVVDRGATEVYWWSDEVHNYVKQERYEAGNVAPVFSMVLVDHGRSSGLTDWAIVTVGVVSAVLAAIVLAAVLVLRKRSPKGS